MMMGTYVARENTGGRAVAAGRATPVKRISLQAIFAVVVAIAAQLLLSFLGTDIGLGLVDRVAGGRSFGIAGGLWWRLLTRVVSVSVAGDVALLAGIGAIRRLP
jgi:hypothetical protein